MVQNRDKHPAVPIWFPNKSPQSREGGRQFKFIVSVAPLQKFWKHHIISNSLNQFSVPKYS